MSGKEQQEKAQGMFSAFLKNLIKNEDFAEPPMYLAHVLNGRYSMYFGNVAIGKIKIRFIVTFRNNGEVERSIYYRPSWISPLIREYPFCVSDDCSGDEKFGSDILTLIRHEERYTQSERDSYNEYLRFASRH